jgi:hypothetical protein
MASKGYIATLLNRLDPEVKQTLIPAFDHLLDTWKLGTGVKAANAAWYRFSSTTAADANTEFSIEHGLNQVPTQVVPFLDLSQVNSALPSLTVSRAPDTRRIYLSSPSTSVVFSVFVEV